MPSEQEQGVEPFIWIDGEPPHDDGVRILVENSRGIHLVYWEEDGSKEWCWICPDGKHDDRPLRGNEIMSWARIPLRTPTPDAVNPDKAVVDQDHDDRLWQVLDDVQRALAKGINGRTLAISALRTRFPAPDMALMPEAAAWLLERPGNNGSAFPRLVFTEAEADRYIEAVNVNPPVSKRPLFTTPTPVEEPSIRNIGGFENWASATPVEERAKVAAGELTSELTHLIDVPLAYYEWLATIERDVRVSELTPPEIDALRAALAATNAGQVEASQTVSQETAVETARHFHEAYERLAPSFGYDTRADTKAFDPESANGRLMTAVCSEMLAAFKKSEVGHE